MLSHSIQRATVLEPLDLTLVERVYQLRLPYLPILGMHSQRQGLANGELGAHNVHFVVGVDFVVVGWVGKGQRQHTLFLEVGLMLGLD